VKRYTLFLFIFSSVFLFSREKNYYFTSLDVKDGLSQNTVNTIIQDRMGFLWLGTKDGLNRYDGTEFRIYRNNPSDTLSLQSNFINVLYQDKNDNIWIGTDSGLDVFSPRTDVFTHIHSPKSKDSLLRHNVTLIKQGPDESVWVAIEYQGLFRYKDLFSEPQFYSCEVFPSLSSVSSLVFDESGIVWIGNSQKGLYCTADSFQTVCPFLDKVTGSSPFMEEPISSVAIAPYNCILVGSLRGGLWSIDLFNHNCKRLLYKDDEGVPVRCRTILCKDNQLFVGTESGLFIHETTTHTTVHFKSSYQDPYSLSANSVYSLCEDREGAIWIGTYFGGVNCYSPSYALFEKYYPENVGIELNGKRIREICQNRKGIIWIGSEDSGLYMFNPLTRHFTAFASNNLVNNIHGLCLVGDSLWVGTISAGLMVIDTNSGRILKRYENTSDDKPLNDNDIYSISKTNTNDVYIGTKKGLMKYNPETDSFDDIAALSGKHIYDIKQDVSGNLWLATYADGVWCFRPSDNQWVSYHHNSKDPHSLPYDIVLSVFIDSNQRLWFTTQGAGCCYYRPKENDFVCISKDNGLPDNVVYQIVEDKSGKLWMSTANGLACLNPHSDNSVTVFNVENGLLSNQFNYKSSLMSRNGTIYMGSIHGLIAFNPEDVHPANYVPELCITDFSLLGQIVKPGEESTFLECSIEYAREIVLKHNQNSFSFRLLIPNFISSKSDDIEYCLEGFDSEWHTGDLPATVSYSNLDYGKYVFKARNKSGLSSKEQSVPDYSLQITIRPPLYLSFPAIILYILVFFLILTFVIRQVKKKNQVRKREYMYKIEQEKERAIYDSKLEFFSNITHEIKTPLTLINGPLECILDRNDLNPELKEDLQIIHQNTERLMALTVQLLDFKKIESRKYSLDFANCNVSSLLKETYLRFTSLAKQKQIEMELCLPEYEVWAQINKEAVIKILSNMLNNGLKYSQSFLKVTLSEDNVNELTVITENDGDLVPDNMKEDIFKPFVRFRGSENNNPLTGTGIGLGLSRSLAELHNGTLVMLPSSNVNVFKLTIPLKQDSLPLIEQLHRDDDEIINQTDYREDKTSILIVEDDSIMISFISRQLSKSFNVFTASNGKEALELMECNNVMLVVSDIMMPEMDGIALCNAIKTDIRFSHIPVILLTAKTGIQSKIEGMQIGADSFIEKPFSPKYLIACISNLLDGRERLRKQFAASPTEDTSSIATTQTDIVFINKVNEIIEANYMNSDFSMDDLALDLGMSRSSFYRKISGVLDMTPNDYLRLVRLKRAAKLLQNVNVRVSEVCYIVGFNSPSYFAKCFQKQFGFTPKDFLERNSIQEVK